MLLPLLILASTSGVEESLAALNERSLQCSACEIVASQLFEALDSKIATNFKEWPPDSRTKKLNAAWGKACRKVGKMQVAQLGEAGSRKFGDFNELMQQGGTLSNLNMGPEQAKTLQSLCEAFVEDKGVALGDRMAEFTGLNDGGKTGMSTAEKKKKKKKRRRARRVLDFRMRDEVCEKILNACAKVEAPPRGSFDDDDDDDDDDDREL
jgi:hypothetical protein